MSKPRTKIDWLALSVIHNEQATRAFYASLFGRFGQVQFEVRPGKYGYTTGARVTIGGADVGLWCWGGASQRGRSHVDVNGQGCALIDDWEAAYGAVNALPGVRAKRVDIAADFYRGEVTVEQARAAYRAGKFTIRRTPNYEHVRSSTGQTFYVGTRGNDVLFRAYEKGRKEFSELPAHMRSAGPACIVGQDDEGQPFNIIEWVRLELELRDKTRAIPLEVIPERDQYFTGAYPFCREVFPQIEPRVMVRPEQIAAAELETALSHLQRQWGSTLVTALHCYGGDYARLIGRVLGAHHNERLVEAGVLLHGAREAA